MVTISNYIIIYKHFIGGITHEAIGHVAETEVGAPAEIASQETGIGIAPAETRIAQVKTRIVPMEMTSLKRKNLQPKKNLLML